MADKKFGLNLSWKSYTPAKFIVETSPGTNISKNLFSYIDVYAIADVSGNDDPSTLPKGSFSNPDPLSTTGSGDTPVKATIEEITLSKLDALSAAFVDVTITEHLFANQEDLGAINPSDVLNALNDGAATADQFVNKSIDNNGARTYIGSKDIMSKNRLAVATYVTVTAEKDALNVEATATWSE